MSDDKVVSIRRRGRRPRPNAAKEKPMAVFLRLPESLFLRIEAAAAANYRTMSQECLMRMVRDDAEHADR